MPNTATGAQAAAAKAALLNAAGNSVNLVARDAVQAAHLIPTLATPPAHAISGAELVVLGVPTVGAKSRVETQIKISLALVRPRAERGAGASVASSSMGEGGRISDEMIMVDGSLDARAADDLERIGTWSHLRLPKNLALKNKPGKQLSAAALAKRANKPGECHTSCACFFERPRTDSLTLERSSQNRPPSRSSRSRRRRLRDRPIAGDLHLSELPGA